MALTPQQVRWAHIKKLCEDDFDYLARNYLRFKSKHVIGFPTLKFNNVQQYLHAAIQDQLRRTGKVRQVWGKSRQVGSSTYCRALSFHRTAFRDHTNALVVAHDEPDAMEMFQMDTGFYDALPSELRPLTKYRSKSKMEFTNRNSKILVNHARNMHVGASQMNHIVHLTEVARYPNGSEIQGSLFPSISSATGRDCSVVIIESTSRFGGDWFKDFAEEAMKERNEYEFHFVPWFMHQDYRLPVPKGFELTEFEKDLLRQYRGLTLENMVWYRLTRSTFSTNLALFGQEYAFSWGESWILPQGTMQTFQEEHLTYIHAHLKPGVRHVVTANGLQENIGGEIEVWQLPKEGVYYDIGVDVAGGATERADWTVIIVLRRDTLEQVAEVRLHMDPSSEEFLNLTYWLGRAYNSGQMTPDITGGWGHALLSDLQKRNYPNIWQWRRRDDAQEKVSSRLGFYYTKRDKTWLVHNAVKALIRERPIIRSRELLKEMRSFLTIGIDEWGAAPGTHDDVITAWMLAVLSATDERAPIFAPLPPTQPKTGREWLIHDIDADLLDGVSSNTLGSYVDRVLSTQ